MSWWIHVKTLSWVYGEVIHSATFTEIHERKRSRQLWCNATCFKKPCSSVVAITKQLLLIGLDRLCMSWGVNYSLFPWDEKHSSIFSLCIYFCPNRWVKQFGIRLENSPEEHYNLLNCWWFLQVLEDIWQVQNIHHNFQARPNTLLTDLFHNQANI